MRSAPFTFALLTLCIPCALADAGEPYRPRVGQRHFDFTLPRIDDRQPVSLSDFRGTKVLLINFASW